MNFCEEGGRGEGGGGEKGRELRRRKKKKRKRKQCEAVLLIGEHIAVHISRLTMRLKLA